MYNTHIRNKYILKKTLIFLIFPISLELSSFYTILEINFSSVIRNNYIEKEVKLSSK